MQIEIITTASLGNRGYLIYNDHQAIAIDVQRDYKRWTDLAKRFNVEIKYVFETHMHNDYVTGGFRLAKLINAIYVVPAESGQSFNAVEAKDGDIFNFGNIIIKAIRTPGHTSHHTSYEVISKNKKALFSGGGLLYGTVGRTDLISQKMTLALTEAQYNSAQKVLNNVDLTAELYPTHGFGSFCSSSPGTKGESSTLSIEKETNIAYTTKSKKEFIDLIIKGLGAYPNYYAFMGKLNQNGCGDIALKEVRELSTDKIRDIIKSSGWLVDIRNRKLYAANHPQGSIGIEMGGSFASYLGWVIPWGDSITLISDDISEINNAQIELGRIGMDQFISNVSTSINNYLAITNQSYQIHNFQDLNNKMASKEVKITVLDVRNPVEWTSGHIDKALHIPIYELINRFDEVKNINNEIWVHCASGYRASIGASILAKNKKTVVLIDDNISNAAKLNLLH